jgi:hypothetical protein
LSRGDFYVGIPPRDCIEFMELAEDDDAAAEPVASAAANSETVQL